MNQSEVAQTAAQLKPRIARDPWSWTGHLSYGHDGYVLGLRQKSPREFQAAWTTTLASSREPSRYRLFKSVDAALKAAEGLGLLEVHVSISQNIQRA